MEIQPEQTGHFLRWTTINRNARGHPWQHLASEQVLHTFVQGCHLPSQRYPARLEACNGEVDTAPPPHSTHCPHPRKSSWANFYFLPQRNKVVSRHSSTKKKKGVCVYRRCFRKAFCLKRAISSLGRQDLPMRNLEYRVLKEGLSLYTSEIWISERPSE